MRCTILLQLDYQPFKFKLDPRLARQPVRPVAIQQNEQTPRFPRTRVHHLRQVSRADHQLPAHEIRRDPTAYQPPTQL